MGISERKEREKALRIKEILKAARKLFTSKGYSNTTMLDIAEKSELSRRTLYHYFTSKEEISYTLMLEAYESLRDIINDAIDGSMTTGYDKLITVQNAFLKFYREKFELFSFTLQLDHRLNLMEDPSEEAKKCLMVMDSLFVLMESIYEEGLKDGSIRDIGSTPRQFSVTILTMIQATLQKIYVRKSWMESNKDINDIVIIKTMFNICLTAITPL
ncbi:MULTISPECIES: TetR/AcrR family transcriptional regulator [unclassified Oceanispirochaeta]|uniref:TetR/AcrR family transcriptional regulator n=1 Tax=unclassified Oceanispirochaeta TaxID=2635722 RepID=UPI000E096E94|nr:MULTISPECIES: TetR/AcrR family transcriptional regulator [unclassified Oceanispirochaeta]MBF9017338.1 TetR/AcrR family transcriptional regulator [Oceanispirochaeta sp. M2]NPD73713.1 TetR/AcrR family transcriptional regulator [Oceanispirochaeta sp. M1]RDG30468.1 TetR/AcrR family transcriptional regulator [Oceanispirochaeta sp. M1]